MFLNRLLKALVSTSGLLAPMLVLLLIRFRLGSYSVAGMGTDYPAFVVGLAIDTIVVFLVKGWGTAAVLPNAPPRRRNGATPVVPQALPPASRWKMIFLILAIVCLVFSAIGLVMEYQVLDNHYKPEDLPISAAWTLFLLAISYVANVGMRF